MKLCHKGTLYLYHWRPF